MLGNHPALVVSGKALNVTGHALVCPITNGKQVHAKASGLAVDLATYGTNTTGIVLPHQVKFLDLSARKTELIESSPRALTDEVVAINGSIIESDD